jgi:hypothetical protein
MTLGYARLGFFQTILYNRCHLHQNEWQRGIPPTFGTPAYVSFCCFRSCAAGPSSHFHERERIMGKGNNSQKNDKKNKKVKQDSKKAAAKPATKR